MKPQLVLFAAPCKDTLDTSWYRRVTEWQLSRDSKLWYFTPLFAEHTAGRIDVSRSKIIRAQLELQAPWCISLDTDAKPLVSVDDLMPILEEDRLKGHEMIVGPTLKDQVDPKLLLWTKPEWGINIRKDAPFRITGAGLGFVALSLGGAMKLKVLNTLETLDEKLSMYCEANGAQGEDNSLIANANDSGLLPVCDPRIVIGHSRKYDTAPDPGIWEKMAATARDELKRIEGAEELRGK